MSNAGDEYIFTTQAVNGGLRFEAKIRQGNYQVPFKMALSLLQKKDPEFTKAFFAALKSSVNFEAYFFETPSMTDLKVLLTSNFKK